MAVIESKGDGYSLFNGVKLRSLPEWDKETYPYAFIAAHNTNGSRLLVVSNAKCVIDMTQDNDRLRVDTDCVRLTQLNKDGSPWILGAETNVAAGTTIAYTFVPVWSNYDILNEDNTVHLAASEPISLDGMNVIEWDGDTTGLEQFPIKADFHFISNTTDVDTNKEWIGVRTFRDGADSTVNRGTPNKNDGYFSRSKVVSYVPAATADCPTVGLYIYGGDTIYASLFAYYPIESSDSDGEKTNIHFNNKTYSVNNSSLALHSADLKSHFSAAMSGSGATIKLGGVVYNIDATKLANARNAFIQHLGTIAGSGHKVVVGGVEYGIDAGKVAGAISGLGVVLEGLQSGGNDGGGEIIGYSYNGTVLPELPEFDKSVYLYAWIRMMDVSELGFAGESLYHFVCANAPFVYYPDGNAMLIEREDHVVTPIVYAECYYATTQELADFVVQNAGWSCGFNDSWGTLEEYGDGSAGVTFTYDVVFVDVWASHDILNDSDSSVYLSASDPVPVYA